MRYLLLLAIIASCARHSATNDNTAPKPGERNEASEFIMYDLMPGNCEYIRQVNTTICSPSQ